nr:GDYXXLXY domain-containing protein [Rhizobium paknamense]
MFTYDRRNRLFRLLSAAILIAALETVAIGAMIEHRARILRSGADVLLKTTAVDPRDLLRGDYVLLNYGISVIPEEKLVGERPSTPERLPLNVRLTAGADGFYQVEEASFETLPVRSGSVILQTEPFDFIPTMLTAGGVLHVRYGIERYYLPEGEGKEIEAARNAGDVTVDVRVSSGGQPQIRQLRLGGKPLHSEPLY